MKKIINSMLLGLLLAIFVTVPAIASPMSVSLDSTESNIIIQEDDRIVVQLYDRRGNWIADAILEISNPRNGKIGIYMETQCHMAVDEIMMDVAIEEQIGTNSWQQVDYLSYTFTAKDNEELTDATVDLQLSGQESNQVYRLRGLHAVFLNGSTETLRSETPGLTITDH